MKLTDLNKVMALMARYRINAEVIEILSNGSPIRVIIGERHEIILKDEPRAELHNNILNGAKEENAQILAEFDELGVAVE